MNGHGRCWARTIAWSEPAEEYLEYLRAQQVSPNTVKSYARALALWWQFLEAVRAGLGCGDVGELGGVPDLVADRGRARGRLDRASSGAVCRVDDRGAAGRGDLLLRLSRAQRRGCGPGPASDHPSRRRPVQAAAGTRRPAQGPPAGGDPGAPAAPSGAADLDAGADRADL